MNVKSELKGLVLDVNMIIKNKPGFMLGFFT